MQHSLAFDPTYGYDLPALEAVDPPPHPPSDFAPFWQGQYQLARAVVPSVELRPIADASATHDVFEINFDSLGQVRIGGWLTRPKGVQGAIRRGLVVGHGYGGRAEPAFDLPGPPAVAIFPCARGFHRSAQPPFPDNSARHVLHGIASREAYIHLGCAADLVWCAASALLAVEPAIERLDYLGGSFGGGIGALGLPWDDRFDRAELDVPSFGQHSLRLQMPCNGSGEAVRLYHQRHPEVTEVLAYFDAATAASFLHLPMLFSVARFDPAVPPPGQFAVANACPEPKTIIARTAGHFECAEDAADNAALRDQQEAFFHADFTPEMNRG